ncbi:hypothetical protein HX109_01775 [Galbibacter sp. BG1]|uniref:hypothetical protein n=1 Tax=Galbibacter sp. BG1 TaxID=1170699 RepID=UPI0015BA3DA2|nr:hypothetical protein [Galbibacter sp. BG1]QLE00349.1 hypothetical protein HX109_01775 [Galbibacter sp. BG1]
MKSLYKSISAILICCMFLFNSCSKDDSQITYDLTGNWKVAYYIENGIKITKTKENTWLDINNGDITASFAEPQNGGVGSISGIKVTNSYSGEFRAQTNGEISIGQVFQTEANEPEWTELYKISEAEYYEIKNSKLHIYYNGRKNVIVLEKIRPF